MNAERLLQQYERIIEAPDAIARLRRFILDLAVRGRLVPQDPDDEPASELLKRIVSEKRRFGAKNRPAPLKREKVAFALPRCVALRPLGGGFPQNTTGRPPPTRHEG